MNSTPANVSRQAGPPDGPLTVRVRLFAFARDLAGRDTVELSLREPARVADVRRELARTVPDLAGWVDRMMFAVDARYADDQMTVQAHNEIACIPPVSGG